MKSEWTGSKRGSRVMHWICGLTALLAAVSGVFVLQLLTTNPAGRFVKGWRYIAEAYLDADASFHSSRGVISQTVLALHPVQFTGVSGYYTIGEGTYFDVDTQLNRVDEGHDTLGLNLYGERTIMRPLPYPPQALWCLDIAYADEPDRVIFLGYYADMYSAEWIAHVGESAPFSAEFIENVMALGCDLSSLHRYKGKYGPQQNG